ncbi:Delta-aminolevulinic acid dehydratase [Trinorchestia longiramus]|nr:Delta-aminolevulinic acid dehydratase [Trinorchestia longiramus]
MAEQNCSAATYKPPSNHLLHPGYANATLRAWQACGTELHPHNFVLPLFVTEASDGSVPVSSMPGVERYSVSALQVYLASVVQHKLSSVLLFGVVEAHRKDSVGSFSVHPDNPVVQAVKMIRTQFPNLTIICDVCLCAYTTHGHCGELNDDGTINNSASIKRLAQQALAYAQAGAHVVAPSDMMDGRVGAIKAELHTQGLAGKVSVLSYAVKFASCFYGPFRDAAASAPAAGDRQCYQLPPASSGLGLRAAARDVSEGADMLMVKPGIAYLDMVRKVKDAFPNHPMFIYQVSGEYAMLYHAAEKGVFELRRTLSEVFRSMRRAGADVIISYYTPLVLQWLQEGGL